MPDGQKLAFAVGLLATMTAMEAMRELVDKRPLRRGESPFWFRMGISAAVGLWAAHELGRKAIVV